MNTNIVVSLDERREKKDGSFPLVMRLGHNKRTTAIPLNISLKKKDWDEELRVVKKSYVGTNSVTRLNHIIQKSKSEAMDIILKLNENGRLQGMSILELRGHLVRKNAAISFYDYTEQQVQELISANRIGTARSYKGVISVLKTFTNNKELYFKDITYSFLKKFENSHLGKGGSYNGLAVYFRTIRAAFNKAIKEGAIDKDNYPFADYKIKSVPTEKRALDLSLLQIIIKKQIDSDDICFNARNYFVASYMMYGMNFTDMAFLKKANIIDGRIQYRRRKTSKLYDIKINPNLNKILQHYISLDEDSPYVFPIIKRDSALLQDKDIQWARKRYNIKLKKLAEKCEIEQNLTSYVSRHSFATQAMLQQVPLNAISAMLGHSSLKTTEVYLKSLPSNILDDYNAKILQ
ncbi:site-specific integrase [Mucilaginibacter sp. PAMB04274]|uniref:site-specific integrase n=1 Tax=Mucilaginibacter sp. PAMB04274 TaxID=3138568 RepID=UPI0031F616D4